MPSPPPTTSPRPGRHRLNPVSGPPSSSSCFGPSPLVARRSLAAQPRSLGRVPPASHARPSPTSSSSRAIVRAFRSCRIRPAQCSDQPLKQSLARAASLRPTEPVPMQPPPPPRATSNPPDTEPATTRMPSSTVPSISVDTTTQSNAPSISPKATAVMQLERRSAVDTAESRTPPARVCPSATTLPDGPTTDASHAAILLPEPTSAPPPRPDHPRDRVQVSSPTDPIRPAYTSLAEHRITCLLPSANVTR